MAAAMVKSREENEGESSVACAIAPACWEMSASCFVGVCGGEGQGVGGACINHNIVLPQTCWSGIMQCLGMSGIYDVLL